MGFNMGGDITRRNGRAALFRFEGVDLLVHRANRLAFTVIQGGPVQCAWQVIQGVFGFAACVYHGVKFTVARDDFTRCDQLQTHGSSFFNAGHTLPSMIGCAASTG